MEIRKEIKYMQGLDMVSGVVDVTLLGSLFNLKREQHVSAFSQLLTNSFTSFVKQEFFPKFGVTLLSSVTASSQLGSSCL